MSSLLTVEDLSVEFSGKPVVRGISFQVEKGQILCIVGESGSGKSMTALSILGLVPEAGTCFGKGIWLENTNLLSLSEKELCTFRGKQISMIFQEPMTSLNPVLRILDQITEPLILHEKLSKKEAKEKALALMQSAGLDPNRAKDYPHQLSGGMRQRVMIAIALACSPKLLLADEPTSALDVTIQGQILYLLKNLVKGRDMGLLLITHDFKVVQDVADHVAVMYAGQIVEEASVEDFLAAPSHPYSQGLLNCIPSNNIGKRLPTIPGALASSQNLPQGCTFGPRCAYFQEKCLAEPPVVNIKEKHFVRCWRFFS